MSIVYLLIYLFIYIFMGGFNIYGVNENIDFETK